MGLFNEKERKSELQSIRKEFSEMDREEGARKRPAVTMLVLIIIVWLVFAIFDVVTGKSFTGITALVVAAYAGLCWGEYRESRERATGVYAVVAGVVAALFAMGHFMGL